MLNPAEPREWEERGMFELISSAAAAYGDTPVLRYGERTISYAQLETAVREVAAGFWTRGLRPGDRIAIILEDIPEAVLSITAASALGCPPVVLSVRNTPHELEYLLNAGKATAVVTQAESSTGNLLERFAPVLSRQSDEFEVPTLEMVIGVSRGTTDVGGVAIESPEPIEFDSLVADGVSASASPDLERAVSSFSSDDTAAILFTSGTTSTPKAVIRTHQNLLPHAVDAAAWYSISEGDVLLNAYPIASAAGILRYLMAVARGGTCLLQDHYTLENTMELLVDGGVNYLSGPDTIYKDILDHPRASEIDTDSLDRVFLSMGGGLDVEFGSTVEELFETPIENAYGLTEANPLVLRTLEDHPFEARVRPGGRTGYGTEVRLDGKDGSGEICLRGISVTPGYENNEAANEAAFDDEGWFHTSDEGYRRTEGDEEFYFFTNRSDAMFQVGGFNVSPVEVEECLREHPAIDWAGVAGIDHDRLGAVPAAAVTTTDDVTPAEITEFCESRLSGQKVPRTVFVVDESDIPFKVGHHGRKIDRSQLAELLAEKNDRTND